MRNLIERFIGAGFPASWLPGWSGGSLTSLADAFRFGQEDALTDPVAQHVWVYATIRARARALSSTPLQLWRGEGDDAPELTGRPIVDLLQRPHPLISSSRLWMLTSVYFDAYGTTYWLLYERDGDAIVPVRAGLRDPIRTPVEILPVPGPKVKVDLDERTCLPRSYRYGGKNGKTEEFGAGGVVVFPDITNGSIFGSVGATTALRRRLLVDFAAETLEINAAKNGGLPSLLFSTDQDLTEHSLEQLHEELDRWISNPDRHGKPALLSGGMKVSNTAFSPRDMEHPKSREWSRDAILGVYGVTKPIVSITDDVNRANAREAKAVFWEETIIPQQNLFLDQLTDGLLRRLSDAPQPISASFDLSGVEALGESLDDKIERTLKLHREASIPFEQAAALSGWEIDPTALEDESSNVAEEASANPATTLNGAQIKELSNLVQAVATGALPKESAVQLIVASFPFDEERARRILAAVEEGSRAPAPVAPVPPPPAASSAPEDEDDDDEGNEGADVPEGLEQGGERSLASPVIRAVTEAERRAVASSFEEYVSPRERELTDAVDEVQSAFVRAALTKVRQVARGERAFRPRRPEVRALEDDVPQEVLDELLRTAIPGVEAWVERFEDAAGPLLVDYYFEAAKNLAFQYGWDQVVEETDALSLTFLSTKNIELAEGAMSTLADDVRDTIARTMFENGGEYTIAEISQRLADTLDEQEAALEGIDTAARAQRIARTEVSAVVNQARDAEMALVGVEQRMWITANDGEVRESHAINDGEIRRPGETFPNGMLRPHDSPLASEVVNCRCHLVPIDPDVEEILGEDENAYQSQ